MARNNIDSYKLIGKNSEVIKGCWSSCTGVFMAGALLAYHQEFIMSTEVIRLEVFWEYPIRINDYVKNLINILVPDHQIIGRDLKMNIKGIPFDYVVVACRLIRHNGYISEDCEGDDCIALDAPLLSDLLKEKHASWNDHGNGNQFEAWFEDNEWGLDEDEYKARVISATSLKRKKINPGMLRPLGGPDGSWGYFKDWELFTYALCTKVDQWGYWNKPTVEAIKRVFEDAEGKDVGASVDYCLHYHGPQALAAAKKYEGGLGKLIDERCGND